MVGQVGYACEGVALELGKRGHSLALIGVHLILARPTISTAERVHIIGLHHVVSGRQSEVQTWGTKISLLIEQRGSQALRCAIFAAKHDFHQVGILYLCILVGVVEPKHQLVCPFLVHQTYLEDDRLVVVSVVETTKPSLVLAHGIGFQVSPLRLYLIVVVAIVLIGVQAQGQALLACPSQGEIAAMGVEGSVAVAGVHIGMGRVVGHDVDGTAEGISSEVHGHHALVDLDAVGKAGRDVVDTETGRCAIHRHTVDKEFHMLARETVEIDTRTRAKSAILAHLYPRHTVQDVRQVEVRVTQTTGVHRHHVECR